MVQTRSSVKKIESGKARNNDGRITTEHSPGNSVPSPAKKRRINDKAAPKRQCRGKPEGELCQLNLDVLFLVRISLFVSTVC